MASAMQKFGQTAKNSISEDLKGHLLKEHPPPNTHTQTHTHTTVPFCILKSTSTPLTVFLKITVKGQLRVISAVFFVDFKLLTEQLITLS